MKNWRTKKLIAGLIVFTLAFSLFGVADGREVDPDFDPDNLLSDEEMLDYRSMSLKDIESFLAGKDGVLKNYICREVEIEKIEEAENTNNTNNSGEAEGKQACGDYLSPANSVCLINGPGYCPDGQNNNSLQVEKVQNFFGDYYKDITLAATGIFNQATFDAAIKFQNEYKKEVLTSCGLNNATGYVGPSTIKQINKLYCQKLNTWSGSLGVVAESDDNSGGEDEEDENKNTETVWRCFMKADPLPKKETDGREWTAAEVVYNLAREYKISPKVILVTLQKEQSLINNSSPSQGIDHALDWAMGYGCLERGGWNEKLRGFYKQVDGACWQFRRWFDYPENYTHRWQKGVTYYRSGSGMGTAGLDNETDVTPASNATAFLYRYTPHIFNGNYNFWKFWREYFGDVKGASEVKKADKIILDPNLLQNSNTPFYYLDGGFKRSLGGLSETELVELGFDKNRATPVSLKIINSYPTGKKVAYGSDGDLLENLAGEIYLIEDGKKRKFYSKKSVEDSGYQLSQIKKDTSQLDYYLAGETMPFPDGALIKADGPAVYKIENGERKAFTSPALFEILGCRWEEIIEVEESELANYPNGSNLKYPNGVLIRAQEQSKIYLIDGGGKAIWIKTAKEFIGGGYDWGDVIEVDISELDLYL